MLFFFPVIVSPFFFFHMHVSPIQSASPDTLLQNYNQKKERKEKILGGPLLFAIFLVFLTNTFLNPLCIILLAARLCISFFSGILSANLKMHDWNALFFKRGKEQTETETDILVKKKKGQETEEPKEYVETGRRVEDHSNRVIDERVVLPSSERQPLLPLSEHVM